MNYPVWQLDYFGGGLLIALIAVFHVYIAHFAVGGGLFLVLSEYKARQEKSQAMLDFVRKHARLFLLITMVAGGITGVGIWFIIALLNPAGTSILIHTFVFGWAIEWVFFLIEIVALFIYYYKFDQLSPRHHILIGWIYFGAAWMSLFMINGIIDFMLTPGQWLENYNFWSGFFNPTFWPALWFRTFFSVLIAGLFGLVTATWLKDTQARIKFTRYSALWLIIPFSLFLVSAFWYMGAIPEERASNLLEQMPATAKFLQGFVLFSPILIIGTLGLAIRLPRFISRSVALVLLVTGLLYMGCFEFIREGARRPFIIYEYMYSNSILLQDAERISQEGVLANAKWSSVTEITKDNQLQAGKQLFTLLCSSCHSVGGPIQDIKKLTQYYTPTGLDNMIAGMHRVYPSMPPFIGTAKERYALATYLAYGLNGRQDPGSTTPASEKITTPAPFQAEEDQYILLAWNRTGMHTFSDALPYFSFRQPGNTIHAQLIRRGETPEVVEDATIIYQVEPGFDSPSDHVSFWDAALPAFDKPITINTGFSGNGTRGEMQPDAGLYEASGIPVVPYKANQFDPYPLLRLEAESPEGDFLAQTATTLPVSTEMGCNSCHGGQWRVDGKAGFTQATALNILSIHDKLSGTRLAATSASGKPVICQECHTDEQTGEQLNLSSAIHGFHATFFASSGAEACSSCHPSSPEGATQMLRGIHNSIGLDCTNCHGTMTEHALGLLRQQLDEKKLHATQYVEQILSYYEEEDPIQPRIAWSQQPDCLHCHEDFEEPGTDATLNQYTSDETTLYRSRTDESGSLYCATCHGSPHAVYPAENDHGTAIHNLGPLQYQDEPLPIGSNFGCAVCHTIDMEDEMHHPNMLREFRNM